MKLTKRQITEGLELIPMDRLLLGTGTELKLTGKQRKFAEELAKGNTKVGAYRKAYNTKAKPAVQATDASNLSRHPHIVILTERISQALEASKYQTPAHIRALTIHELTKHAISEDTAPAQRIKALELLGKITEVALFTERRETVVTTDSTDARAKLMNAMRLAITNSQAIDAEYTSADDLLAELSGTQPSDDEKPSHERHSTEPATETEPSLANPEGNEEAETETPPTPRPLKEAERTTSTLHSIPHNESIKDSIVPHTKSLLNSQRNSAILEDEVSKNTGLDQESNVLDGNI